MSRDATTAFARTLVDEWVRQGVTDASLAPGSRSAPLALALADDERIRINVHLDERSASFFALGLGKASGRPA
ncbi:MAG TPA: thiamine pyrophosphate-binding protein, partial [Acidimicrobiia bacterium]|nr:thiamine pyrophosphate-binding protein [Acidimicrobiia bacterium]